MKKSMLFLMIISATSLIAQKRYPLAEETIRPKSEDLNKVLSGGLYYPAGKYGNQVVYQVNLKEKTRYGYSNEAEGKVYYDELTGEVSDTLSIKTKGRNILRFLQIDNITLYRGFYHVPDDYSDKIIDELDRGQALQDYQDFWVSLNDSTLKIKSYPEHYSDKDIDYYIDGSGNYVVLNEYVSQYLRSSKADSVIAVFTIENDNIARRELNCGECINSQVQGSRLFFGKKFFYLPGADAYDWKIYSAPLFDLSKRELLAEYIEILLTSPDGKYILGKKQLYGQACFVILDVESKKFDFVIGRDYYKYKYFYSPGLKQFAFDASDRIIYIDYPKEFRFNAIGMEAIPDYTTNEEDSKFWKEHTLPPFE
jgi:hypothetical protein